MSIIKFRAMKPTILALDTSTEACSAALIHADSVYLRFEIAAKAHTQLILPMIKSLLKEANLSLKNVDAIAVGRGPGSFTGVRIGMSVAQGMGYGLNLPLFPISTLEALCYQAKEEVSPKTHPIVIPALDARMQEIYAGGFNLDQGNYASLFAEGLFSPAQFAEKLRNQAITSLVAIGSGWDQYAEQIKGCHHNLQIHLLSSRFPHAVDIAKIAKKQMEEGFKGVCSLNAHPTYLRDNVAQKSAIAPATCS